MNSTEKSNEFRGFKMNNSDSNKGSSEGEDMHGEKDESKSSTEKLPNGTGEEIEPKDEDSEVQEKETPPKVSKEGKHELSDTKGNNEEKSDEPPRKRLRSTSSGALSEKSSQSDKEEKVKDGEADGVSCSDSEDFAGFETPDPNDKEEFMRSLMDEPESIDSSDSGLLTPKLKLRRIDRISIAKKPSINVDVSNPAFRKPFDQGWVRELVYRSTSDSSLKRNADVYYYTPKGKKVRSFREVSEHLSGDLSIDNFTFFKGPIGIGDPDKEIIREAKAKPSFKPSEDGFVSSPFKKATPKIKVTATPKSVPKSLSPESQSTKVNLGGTPKVVFKGVTTPKSKNSSMKSKIGIKERKRRSAGPDDMEMEMISPTSWSPEPKANAGREVCSIECHQAMGIIPTLQCHVCLCLYHPECVGLIEEKHRTIHNYVCKSCQLVKANLGNKTGSSGSSSSVNTLNKGSTLVPISPRVPISNKPVTPPKQSKVVPTPRSQSIVGAVTTWLPPSASIQVSQPATAAKTPPAPSTTMASTDGAPQSLVTINKKQYVLVAKHNVVNITNQPNTAIPAVTPTQNEAQTNSMPIGHNSLMIPQTQNLASPPGVFLVPYTVQPGASQPDPSVPATQYVVVSNCTTPQPNFIISNMSHPLASTPVAHATSLPHTSATQANGVDRQGSSPLEGAAPLEKKSKLKPESLHPSAHNPLTQDFMMCMHAGYVTLLHAFQYLKVHELLRASCVSSMWRHIASHKSLWESVHMKNSRVRDWDGFGRALSKSGTRNLDLKKMLLPEAQEAITEMWTNLSKAVAKVETLKRIDFGRCIPDAIESVAKACPQLESITSLSIRGSELDVSPIADCTKLVELRLKSLGGIELKNLTSLKCLKELKHLSLTTVKSLAGIEEILCEKLESLELGECSGLSETVATEALPKLVNLKRMRLEKGQGPNCPATALLNTIATLPNLTQLELINFDIKPGFDKSLAKCSNLKTLLIIPTYVTQSATTNHVVMGGVSKLAPTLSYFVWGLTLELLRVTDLFIDQVEGQKGKGGGGGGGAGGGAGASGGGPVPAAGGAAQPKKGTGDSIPILKPIVEEGAEGGKEGQTSQVDILALPKLQKVLSTLLPNTKIKILKVPFSATWRQTISESPQ